MLAAKQPLVVPMLLRLSHFKLSSYVVLVVSKQKGITIVFKTDPLQNVDISSTFDSIAVIQSFIQREIEGQLRQMFKEDLPSIIHRLSQQWVKAKVETPYQKQNQSSLRKPPHQGLETMSTPDLSMPRRSPASEGIPAYRAPIPPRRPRSTTGISASNRVSSPLSAPPLTNTPSSSHDPEDEPFDPTYGLRPEGLPTKPGFKGFSNLFAPNKGLADLAEESQVDDETDYQESSGSLTEEEDAGNYDFVDWNGTSNTSTPPEPAIEYEAIPAIGGGTVTRPRIIHSQSQIQSPLGIIASSLGPSISSKNIAGIFAAPRSGAATPGILSRNSSNPYFADLNPPTSAPPIMARGYHSFAGEPGYPDNASTSGAPVRRRSAYAVSVQEDSIYARSAPSEKAWVHPYDLERQRYDLREEEESDEDDEAFDGDQRRLQMKIRQRQQREYLSMHTNEPPPPSSIASSPPRPVRPPSRRRLSVSSNTTTRTSASTSGFAHHSEASGSNQGGNPKIVLRPSLLNNSIHHLSTLSQSNHTLSPYTRSLEHFAVRSGPPRALSTIHRTSSGDTARGGQSAPVTPGGGGLASPVGSTSGLGLAAGLMSGSGSLGRSKGGAVAGIVGLGASTARLGKNKAEVSVKAKRKRMYRIGGKKDQVATTPSADGTAGTSGPPQPAGRAGGTWPDEQEGENPYGLEGKGKERQRSRRSRRASPPGTDFDEDDMDRYFKSMQHGAD